MGAIYSEPVKYTASTQTPLTINQLPLCDELPPEVVRERCGNLSGVENTRNENESSGWCCTNGNYSPTASGFKEEEPICCKSKTKFPPQLDPKIISKYHSKANMDKKQSVGELQNINDQHNPCSCSTNKNPTEQEKLLKNHIEKSPSQRKVSCSSIENLIVSGRTSTGKSCLREELKQTHSHTTKKVEIPLNVEQKANPNTCKAEEKQTEEAKANLCIEPTSTKLCKQERTPVLGIVSGSKEEKKDEPICCESNKKFPPQLDPKIISKYHSKVNIDKKQSLGELHNINKKTENDDQHNSCGCSTNKNPTEQEKLLTNHIEKSPSQRKVSCKSKENLIVSGQTTSTGKSCLGEPLKQTHYQPTKNVEIPLNIEQKENPNCCKAEEKQIDEAKANLCIQPSSTKLSKQERTQVLDCCNEKKVPNMEKESSFYSCSSRQEFGEASANDVAAMHSQRELSPHTEQENLCRQPLIKKLCPQEKVPPKENKISETLINCKIPNTEKELPNKELNDNACICITKQNLISASKELAATPSKAKKSKSDIISCAENTTNKHSTALQNNENTLIGTNFERKVDTVKLNNNVNQPKSSHDLNQASKSCGNGFTSNTPKSNNFELECLNEHNRLRALHNCPPLVLNPKLSESAKNWALNISRSKTIRRDESNNYGENMFITVNMDINGSTPVKTWYNEIAKYNFEDPVFHPNTGHFTQVIWKNSKEIGVGIATRDKSTWVVVYYNPPGNIIHKFEANVPRLISHQN